MSRILTVSSFLIIIGTAMAIIVGLYNLFTLDTIYGQFSGFYLLGCGLFFTPIAAIPFRKAEKWAWLTALGAGGVALIGQLVLVYMADTAVEAIFLPASIFLIVLWGLAIGLSAKSVFAKKI